MYTLSASELLAAWEEGIHRSPVRRALILLEAACPETRPEALEELTIGERDRRLLILRERLFGPRLVCTVSCPKCDEPLESTFSTSDILVSQKEPVTDRLSIKADEYEVHFRPPTSLDLLALDDAREPDESRGILLGRCLLSAHQGGENRRIEELPAHIAAEVVDLMAEHDPQAEVQLALVCPFCGHTWQAVFDIVSFFWAEIDSWAWRTLHQVHILASVYGWHEEYILAMSPWRRQCYLEMVS